MAKAIKDIESFINSYITIIRHNLHTIKISELMTLYCKKRSFLLLTNFLLTKQWDLT